MALELSYAQSGTDLEVTRKSNAESDEQHKFKATITSTITGQNELEVVVDKEGSGSGQARCPNYLLNGTKK